MVIKRRDDYFILDEAGAELGRFDDLATAACVCRFIKAGRLEKAEYDRAMQAMEDSRYAGLEQDQS